MGKTVTGTKNVDTITVSAGSVIVKTGKKKSVKTAIAKSGKNSIYGMAGNDIITIKGGNGNYIYGDDAKSTVTYKDKININGGKKNYIYGGKGNDTITVNKGTTNYIKGGVGNDVFVIGKDSTGTAVVTDFSTKKGNTDKVKIAGGTVKNIKASGKNMVITGGKSGSLTLQKAKSQTFTVTDSDWSYTVSSGKVKLVLNKDFKGEFTAPSFLTTIDARKVAEGYISNVRGNAKANTIYAAKVEGGGYHGEEGNDKIYVTDGDRHHIYPGIGKDTVTINAGNSHEIRCGGGDDEIIIGANAGDGIKVWGTYGTENYNESRETVTIKGGNTHNVMLQDGDDTFVVTSGSGHTLDGGGGNDQITVSGGGNIHSINGDEGDDVISVTGGVNHHIAGGAGNDMITVSNVTFDENSSYHNSNGAYITAVSGKNTITVNNCNNALVYGSPEGDTITVNNSQNAEVNCKHGNDTIKLTGDCSGTVVGLGDGINQVTVAGKNVTLNQWMNNYYGVESDGKDRITVNWSDNIGKLTINTVYPQSDAGIDVLTINNAVRSDFKFVKTSYWDLSIQGNNGCSIEIPGWYSTGTFKNGITVGGTLVSYEDINAEAGFHR